MTGQDKKDKNNILKPKISNFELVSYLVDVGGVGGVVKIIFAVVVWILLCRYQNGLNELIWNVMILDIPCLIDVLSFKIPFEASTKRLQIFRGMLITILFTAILFSLIFLGDSLMKNSPVEGSLMKDSPAEDSLMEDSPAEDLMDAERTNSDDFIIKTLKAFASLSVIGTGFSYAGKVYTEKSRLQQAEDQEGTATD